MTYHPLRRRRDLLIGAAALAAVPSGWTQPTGKPIRLVVPFTPGGSTDILARAIGPKMNQALGVPVVIDNKPGAGGAIGAEFVARAEPDGNTLLMGHIGTLAVNVSLYPKLGYDPVKSFVPVAWVARVPNVLVVTTASGIASFADLIKRAKAAPGKLTYASGGNGSAAHIATEYLKLRTGTHLTHIPYRGTTPAVTDVLAGQVDLIFTGAPTVLQHIASGRLKALAVSSPRRIAALPNVPTVAELGVKDFEADQWYGVVAPAGTLAEVVNRLNGIINKSLVLPDVAAQLAAEGAEVMQETPAAFGQLIAREIPRWREVVKAGNMTSE
ncbi:MAG: tripartite tricarboxylate transporter substrate binding protein [Burkholderiaceae bacterium]